MVELKKCFKYYLVQAMPAFLDADFADYADFKMIMYKHSDLTKQIINAALTVHNVLGFGFLEKVYHNALVLELIKRGFRAEVEKPINVRYDSKIVGEYYADIIVNDLVIVEVKAIKELNSAHEAQLVNYLKATGIEVGLLMNFGASLQFKRKIFETAKTTIGR